MLNVPALKKLNALVHVQIPVLADENHGQSRNHAGPDQDNHGRAVLDRVAVGEETVAATDAENVVVIDDESVAEMAEEIEAAIDEESAAAMVEEIGMLREREEGQNEETEAATGETEATTEETEATREREEIAAQTNDMMTKISAQRANDRKVESQKRKRKKKQQMQKPYRKSNRKPWTF